jgi:acyl carrier protein
MDFLTLVHEVGKLAKPFHQDNLAVPDWDTPFNEIGFDSLDLLVVGIYITDIYGIPEEIGKTMQVKNCTELKAFIDKHKTKEPESLEAALDGVR